MNKLADLFFVEFARYPVTQNMVELHGKTRNQLIVRMRNNAIQRALDLYMLDNRIGYLYVKNDVIGDEERALHYGKPIGSSLGKKGIKDKTYFVKRAELMRGLRSNLSNYFAFWETYLDK